MGRGRQAHRLRSEVRHYAFLLGVVAAPAFAAHPLITEDTGTQGKGGWQFELNGERHKDTVDGETARGKQANAVLSYGFAENADLQIGAPYQDNGLERGEGDAAIDVKWRFKESGPLSLGLKPGITLPTGNDDRGLGAGRVTWGTLAIVSYDVEGAALHSHAGYRYSNNTQGLRKSLWHLSGSVWWKATAALKVVADLSYDTNPDRASDTLVRQWVAGFIYSVTKDLDLDAGYRRGNDPAIDRAWMAGVTLRWN